MSWWIKWLSRYIYLRRNKTSCDRFNKDWHLEVGVFLRSNREVLDEDIALSRTGRHRWQYLQNPASLDNRGGLVTIRQTFREVSKGLTHRRLCTELIKNPWHWLTNIMGRCNSVLAFNPAPGRLDVIRKLRCEGGTYLNVIELLEVVSH